MYVFTFAYLVFLCSTAYTWRRKCNSSCYLPVLRQCLPGANSAWLIAWFFVTWFLLNGDQSLAKARYEWKTLNFQLFAIIDEKINFPKLVNWCRYATGKISLGLYISSIVSRVTGRRTFETSNRIFWNRQKCELPGSHTKPFNFVFATILKPPKFLLQLDQIIRMMIWSELGLCGFVSGQ